MSGVDENVGFLEGRVAPAAVLPVDGGPGMGAADEIADVEIAATELQGRARPSRPGLYDGLLLVVVSNEEGGCRGSVSKC